MWAKARIISPFLKFCTVLLSMFLLLNNQITAFFFLSVTFEGKKTAPETLFSSLYLNMILLCWCESDPNAIKYVVAIVSQVFLIHLGNSFSNPHQTGHRAAASHCTRTQHTNSTKKVGGDPWHSLWLINLSAMQPLLLTVFYRTGVNTFIQPTQITSWGPVRLGWETGWGPAYSKGSG